MPQSGTSWGRSPPLTSQGRGYACRALRINAGKVRRRSVTSQWTPSWLPPRLIGPSVVITADKADLELVDGFDVRISAV